MYEQWIKQVVFCQWESGLYGMTIFTNDITVVLENEVFRFIFWHSLTFFVCHLLFSETCGSQAVYSGDCDLGLPGLGSNIEDPSSCFATIAEIQRCIITLEQEHIQYMRSVQRRTVIGSMWVSGMLGMKLDISLGNIAVRSVYTESYNVMACHSVKANLT